MRTYLIIAALACLGVSPFFADHRIGGDVGGNPHEQEVNSPSSQVESVRTLIGAAQDLIPLVCPYVS